MGQIVRKIVGWTAWAWWVCALYSYRVDDPSWWCVSTLQRLPHNSMGRWGAECAAWCIGLFGASAWLLIVMSGVYLVYRSLSERLLRVTVVVTAGMWIWLSMLIDATLVYGTYPDTVPGGSLGFLTERWLTSTLFEGGSLCLISGMTAVAIWLTVGTRVQWRLCTAGATAWDRVVQLVMRGSLCAVQNVLAFLKMRTERRGPPARDAGAQTMAECSQQNVHVRVRASREVRGEDNEKQNHPAALPPLEQLLSRPVRNEGGSSLEAWCRERAAMLEKKLADLGIRGTVASWTVGPVVVQFAYQPHQSVPVRRIMGSADDLALALKSGGVDIVSHIPGTTMVGINVARDHRSVVMFAEGLAALRKAQECMVLPVLVGVTLQGAPTCVDLAALPHLLIAGSTGSGKSVALHALLMSVFACARPRDCRLILIDPKRLEFASYYDIGHLLTPVVADAREALSVLQWAVQEMERRYTVLASRGVQDVTQYRRGGGIDMPSLVIVIDEWADLMMSGGKDAERAVVRLAQMARAAGIHLVIATQRPSVDVITGLLKVNIPGRIAFKVASKVDSRTILDAGGAERLLGKGDMLHVSSDGKLHRLHGVWISLDEVQRVLGHLRSQGCADYVIHTQGHTAAVQGTLDGEDSRLYREVVAVVRSLDMVSISLLQRRFRIGYNRSARFIDSLEADGIIVPSAGGKMRKVVK